MKKKTLEKLPLETVTLTKSHKSKYILTANIIEVCGQEILLVNVYKNEILKDKTISPHYRIFLTHKEDATQDLQNNKWISVKIENLGGGWYSSRDCEAFNSTTKKTIETFIPSRWGESSFSLINNLQSEIRTTKADHAHELRRSRNKRQMDLIEPLPEDFNEFIEKEVMLKERYTFYQAEKNRRYVNITCSHCGTLERIDTKQKTRPKHNETGICQHCGSRITYKASGIVKFIYDCKETIYMHPLGEGFVSRYFSVTKCSSQGKESYNIYEKTRAVYTGKKVKTYFNDKYSWSRGEEFWWDSNSTAVKYGKGVMYHKNLNEVINHTPFRYSALKQLAEHEPGYMVNQNSFLSIFERSSFLEYFIKMGLYNLANNYADNYYSESVNAKGKNMLEILKLSKQSINRLISLDGNIYTLKLLQLEESTGKQFSDDQITFMTQHSLDIDALNQVIRYTTVGRAIKYLIQNKNYSKKTNNTLHDWNDYIENCKVLKYDLKNEFILFPKHFKQAHDNVADLIIIKQNKKNDKLFAKRMLLANQDYNYETKKYTIKIPETTGEIINEGQQLHHCVGTYVDRILKGESLILFIRLVEEPEKPFYTMEIKQGKVTQVRGKNNNNITPEVNAFVEGFKRKKLSFQLKQEAV